MTWPELLSQDTLALAGNLAARAQYEREAGKRICPAQENLFRALDLTPPDSLKICIVGQDPYHTPGQATGLAFATPDGAPIQPSLRNIYQELHDDLGLPIPASGNLDRWASNGILLLNTSLTVYEHQPNSHANWGWDVFTREVFRAALTLPQPVVFLLWGGKARNFVAGLDITHYPNKFAIEATHPSPFSASSGRNAFLGSRCFSRANQYLIQAGSAPADWRL